MSQSDTVPPGLPWLTNLFGSREVLAYLICTEQEGGAKRLFFSTVSPACLSFATAWYEDAPLNQTDGICASVSDDFWHWSFSENGNGRCRICNGNRTEYNIACVSFLIPGQMIGLFTENEETIQIGRKALHIISFGFCVSAVSVTCCGALEALGKGRDSLLISLLRYAVIMIPAAVLFRRVMGAEGVFFAFPVTEAVTAAAAFWIYRRSCGKEDVQK